MPIKRLQRTTGAFPQIGTLRKGAEKVDEKRPGKDLEHFRFDTDDVEAAERFTEVYGTEPRRINVFLPFATAAENLECWQEHWTAGALQHRCDSETCTRWLTPKGTYSDEPVPCPHLHLDKREKNRCKAVGRLKVVIPELRRLAYVMVLTTSEHDIMTLEENLLALEAQRGSLRGIPMVLSRSPREISTPGGDGGKRVRREKWLLQIEAAPSWVGLQIAAMERQALPIQTSTAPLALTAPTMVLENGYIVDMETGESIGQPMSAPQLPPVQAKSPAQPERPEPFKQHNSNGNGAAKSERAILVAAVQQFFDCATAIGIDVDDGDDLDKRSDDALKIAGKKLRTTVVKQIQDLDKELLSLTDTESDIDVPAAPVLTAMHPSDLKALGLRLIERITELSVPVMDEAALAEVDGAVPA